VSISALVLSVVFPTPGEEAVDFLAIILHSRAPALQVFDINLEEPTVLPRSPDRERVASETWHEREDLPYPVHDSPKVTVAPTTARHHLSDL